MSIDQTIVTTLAWYNTQVNADLAELAGANPELVTEAGTTYFGSVLNLLQHVRRADIIWLQRMWFLETSPPELIDAPSDDSGQTGEELAQWKEGRAALDQRIEELCRALNEQRLLETVSFTTGKGVQVSHQVWHCLFQMFNHGTHHRGQVAQVFDSRGIENDYSNLISRLRTT